MRRLALILCLVLAACSKQEPSPTTPPPPTESPAPKPLASPAHGQENWAVVAYAGPAGADLDAVKQALTAQGLEYGVTFFEGELGCSDGAAAALARPAQDLALTVHFTTEAEAQAFAAGLATPAVGVAKVTQMCAD